VILLLIGVGGIGSAYAKDITWGKAKAGSHSQLRDITWGKDITWGRGGASQKDITWGKQQARGWPGGELTHSSNDTGYLGRAGGAMFFQCNDGRDLTLYRGQWSKGSGGCADVDWLYVFPEEVHICDGNSATGFAHRVVYYPGMSVGNASHWTCKVNLR